MGTQSTWGIHFFYVCTITLRRKKSKFAKILGHQKGSNFGSVYTFFTSAPSPYGEKNPNSAKSWGIKKGQIFLSIHFFCVCTITLRRKKAKFGKILGHQKGSN